jgi:hypothetical protein
MAAFENPKSKSAICAKYDSNVICFIADGSGTDIRLCFRLRHRSADTGAVTYSEIIKCIV